MAIDRAWCTITISYSEVLKYGFTLAHPPLNLHRLEMKPYSENTLI
jgi:hypothetical protein